MAYVQLVLNQFQTKLGEKVNKKKWKDQTEPFDIHIMKTQLSLQSFYPIIIVFCPQNRDTWMTVLEVLLRKYKENTQTKWSLIIASP